jgi:hypothetical protein
MLAHSPNLDWIPKNTSQVRPGNSMTGPKVRLKSWNSLPGHFASLQAVAQFFRNSCTGFPPRWNTSKEITVARFGLDRALFASTSDQSSNSIATA